LAAAEIQIQGVSDGTTWAKNQLDLSRGDVLSFWASGLPDNADCGNLFVSLDGRRLAVTYVQTLEEGRADGSGVRQINVKVPKDIPAGRAAISVLLGNSGAALADIEISS
jgi:uncharacterized protein (TIGR03437 family)